MYRLSASYHYQSEVNIAMQIWLISLTIDSLTDLVFVDLFFAVLL